MSKSELIFSFSFAAITIIITMISVLALWKIFKKANQPGWFSLIPFYNAFVLFEIIGMSPWWLLVLFVIYFFQYFLLFLIHTFFFVPYLFLTFIFSMIIIWYIIICACINLCRSFHKDDAFTIGLIFFPYIFFLTLAFGKDIYIGPSPINDFIFKSKNKTTIIKYCLGCGKKVPDNSMRFCTNCGNPLLKEKNQEFYSWFQTVDK